MLVQEPAIAFTGDTQIEFADLAGNSPVFRAKLLIMECTFVDDSVDVAQAKERGHTHILDLVKYAHKFQVCSTERFHGESNIDRASPRTTQTAAPAKVQTNHELPRPTSPQTTLKPVHLSSSKPHRNKPSFPMHTQDTTHRFQVWHPCASVRCRWPVQTLKADATL